MMRPKHEVSVAVLVTDLRSGMAVSDLMEKHKLSPRGLKSAITKLISSGLLRQFGIKEHACPQPWKSIIENVRRLPRFQPVFPIPIYDVRQSNNRGTIRDITEQGVGTTGLMAELHNITTLAVPEDELGEFGPFAFEAQCKWRQKRPDGACLAGFEITHIAPGYLTELRCLMRVYTVPA